MLQQLISGTAKICVIEPNATRRSALAEGLRSLFGGSVQSMPSLKDLMAQAETGEQLPDWIITGLLAGTSVNALRFLKLVIEQPALHHLRLSLVIDQTESWCLRAAFELGLISAHRKAPDMMSQMAEFAGMLDIARRNDAQESLVSGHFLRQVLTDAHLDQERLAFEQCLLSLNPTRANLVLEYGEALLRVGRRQDSLALLSRLQLTDKTLAERSKRLVEEIVGPTDNGHGAAVNFAVQWGIKNAVIVDPDESIRNLVSEALASVGVTNIKMFADGLSAWEHMEASGEPDLMITEWRAPRLGGDRLLQRMRQNRMTAVPIVIFSSLVKSCDRPVLREFGATDVIVKPMSRKQFLTMLASVIEEDRRPNGVEAYERRIRLSLSAHNVSLATQLLAELRAAGGATATQLDGLDAELAYAKGDFKRAVELAARSISILGEDIALLNLLGKGLLKLGRPREAAQFLNKAQGLSPHNVERLCLLAESQVETNVAAASAAVREAQNLDPKHAQVTNTAAKVALATNNVAETKDLLSRIGDTAEIIAFMNNRAVALISDQRYDEGIATYETALKSLPASAEHLKPFIGYNLGLALIRAGRIPQSITVLDWVAREAEGALEAKSRSLMDRSIAAQSAGKPVELKTGSASNDVKEQILDASSGVIPGEIPIGQLGCHKIYNAQAIAQPEAAALLKEAVRFKMRPNVHKY